MIKKFYQLVAKGPLKHFGGSNRIFSKKIYENKEIAESNIEKFKIICTTEKSKYDLTVLDSVETVSVLELEFEYNNEMS